MNCREFTTIFEERSGLPEAATLHLKDCSGCRKTSREQTHLWQMIEDLPRVDAPKNFDFRVKARIADAKPTNFQPRFLPVLRYVLPLGLAVLLLGFFVFKTANFSDPNAAPVIAEKSGESKTSANDFSLTNRNVLAVVPKENLGGNELNSNITQTKDDRERQIASVNSPKEHQTKSPKNNRKDAGGGSLDSSLTKSNPKYARGLSPNQTAETPPDFNSPKSFSADEILSQLGIEIVSENGKRQVKSIKQNSLAEHSGVRVGDVIEEIDGEVFNLPKRAKKLEGKTLTVRRGAEKIEITLKN